MNSFLADLQAAEESSALPSHVCAVMRDFYTSFIDAVGNDHEPLFTTYLKLLVEQCATPYLFPPFHQAVRKPFDYYTFGLEMFRPLIDFANSRVDGIDHVATIETQLAEGDNVILLANHQTEPDPQVISLMLEERPFVQDMIFVAGHRVTTDPMAIPLSMGRNLLCIYSKRRVKYPPEQKQEKMLYNQRTMQKMAELLAEGGKCIYVAPSGGRDRLFPSGEGVTVAPFDPQSVEMFRLIATQAATRTHFYPLSLYTYPLLPPPQEIAEESAIEPRLTQRTPTYLAFGPELTIDTLPGCEGLGRRERRVARATYIWKIVTNQYNQFFRL